VNNLLMLGLDGATLDLIVPWTHEGCLPTFALVADVEERLRSLGYL